ncbi:MAG: hypothetical protein WBF53_07850 [Litorimonas sp.]
MTDSRNIDPDDADVIVLEPEDIEPEPEEIVDTETGRPVAWPLVLAAGLLLGFGATLGVTWFMLRADPFDPAPFRAEIEVLRAQVAELEAKPDPVIPRVNLAPLQRRVEALEARPTVDPLNEEIVARMEALQADGFEMPELPDIPDVTALETRISELEQALAVLAMEPRPELTVEIPEPAVDPETLPRLPVRALRDGIAQTVGTGLLRRTFSRHVRVRGDDEPDRLLDLIQQDLEAGRARAALAKFDRLPPEVQSLARGWRADMEAALQ